MNPNFEKDYQMVRDELAEMTDLIAVMIEGATRALLEKDAPCARSTIEKDLQVDRFDIEVNDLCVGILAKFSPKGDELRSVTEVMHIIIDMERIGDHAKKISRYALALMENGSRVVDEFAAEVREIGEAVAAMPRKAIKAFVCRRTEKLDKIMRREEQINRLFRQTAAAVMKSLQQGERVQEYMLLMNALRRYERIADHAVNIVKTSFYVKEGKHKRHRDKFR